MIMVKQLIRNILKIWGFNIVKDKLFSIIDMRENFNDPRVLNYFSRSQPILINVPINYGRALPLFNFSHNGIHPFIISLKKMIEENNVNEIIRILKKYYLLVQPLSASELLGFSKDELPLLSNEPSWAAIMPWESRTIVEWKDRLKSSVSYENRKFKKNIGLNEGWAWVGPVSDRKLMIEVNRIKNIYFSILKYGYNSNNGIDGDIQVTALINNNKWRWLAGTGQHRVVALSVLGEMEIPVQITKIVYRDEVDVWPNVQSGVFTKNIALSIFDRFFNDGNIPAITKNWENFAKKESINN